jgi:hypothetical protein
VNGWTSHDRVFGICVSVDGALRAGAADRIRTSAPAIAPNPAPHEEK